MARARAYVRSLNPRLPRSVQILQVGGLANALGNGVVYPFLFIYLHNIRGFALGTVGLVLATNGLVSLVAGPVAGPLVDRIGGRRTLLAALLLLTAGYGGYAFVDSIPTAFATSVVAGMGNGAFWPSQSALIAALTPRDQRHVAFAMQRVVANLGIGLGGLAGGLIASGSTTWSFRALFLIDGATFLAYVAIALAGVPDPPLAGDREASPGSYRDVVRDRVFVGLLGLNTIYITAGFAMLELLPVFMKNHASVSETGVGLVFFANTIVIVVVQLPIARLAEGRRRMPLLALVGVIWATAHALAPVIGTFSAGVSATALFCLSAGVFALGECVYGAVQNPLVADLAPPALLGRYMALSSFSWQVAFTLGPAVGGFLLAALPNGIWGVAGGVCLAAAVASLALERRIPVEARRSPTRAGMLSTAQG